MNTFSQKRIGWLAVALASVAALAACSGSSSGSSSPSATSTSSSTALPGAYGSVPPEASGTMHSGTVTVAEPPNSAPTWILPIVTAATASVYTQPMFDYQMWRPLYWTTNGVEPKELPAMSLANDPVWSNGNKTVTFTLKSNYKWSDGQPLTSKDVLFWWYELKAALKESPANWSLYTPNLGIPDQVSSISAPNSTTVQMNLTKAVNPTWFWLDEMQPIQPMPSHAWAKSSAGGPLLDFTNPANATAIYNYLAAQSKSVSTYASNPLWQTVDGPYKLTSFDATTGSLTMAPNPTYGGPHATPQSNVSFVSYTSDAAEFNAVKAGQNDIAYVPLNDVPQVSSLTGTYNVFGYPGFGFNYITYNFKNPTGDFNNIIGQLYIRQAVAHLEDQAGYIKAFFYGAGGQAYGPVPSIPVSPYTPSNATTAPYPFSTSAAETLLKNHGWSIVPNGTDTCTNPGTGSSQCGAGIPAGTKLEWNLIYNTSPSIIGEQVEDLASQAKSIGMTINLTSSNFNYMIANYSDVSNPKNVSKWAMQDFGGFSISAYPTTFSIFNTGGSFNIGGYSDPMADTLITNSITSPNTSAVTSEAEYLTTQQPSLFQPLADSAFGTAGILVWKKNVSGTPESFESLTQAYWNPEYWFFTS
jgi:peptide/nickel transport system substrate-binding protein